MKKLILMTMGLFLMASVASAEVTTGEMAPNFTLTSASGEAVSLEDFKGQHVVLEWTNHQCPFVVKHYSVGNMQSLQEKWTSEDVIWLTIISSAAGKQGHVSPEEAMTLTEERGASPTAVLLDESGDVGRLYGAKTTPHMFVIDPEGSLVYQGAIDSIASFDSDDIPEATNYVDMALNKSMASENIDMHTTKPYGCSVKY